MRFKRFDKRLWPMLWLGLAIWLGTMLVSAILEWSGSAPSGQGTLMDMAKQMFQQMPLFCLLLICLVQPVLEEFAFRLWGVGNLWTTICCLCLMALFAFSEMGLWAALFIGAFLFEWLRDKNELRRKWLLTLISSAAFALCHVSGFGEFSLGMVLGLLDIFGMAIVMCWLTLNLSIWFSALLHVLNNTLGVLLPMLFVPDPVSRQISDDTCGKVEISLQSFDPFAFEYNDSVTRYANGQASFYMDSTTTDFQFRGEPAEIASRIAEACAPRYTYFQTEGKGESLEERVLFGWHSDRPQLPDMRGMMDDYLQLLKQFNEDTIIFDTASVMLKEAYLIYKDGHEELLDATSEDQQTALTLMMNSGYRIIWETEYLGDTAMATHLYGLPVPNPLASQMDRYMKFFYRVLPFRIEYRDARKATLITIKTK